MTLVEHGELELATTARSVLGDDLPLIDDRVNVEHLLTHRSGIGDYLDEETVAAPTDFVMPVPVHVLAGTEEYLRVLAGHRQVFAPGERFAYNNSGFVVLALIAERVGGIPFTSSCRSAYADPPACVDTAFLRSDEPTGRTALGYLDVRGLRTNVLHLPVLGSGDGGIYSTAADIRAFWMALFSGRIVSSDRVAEMVQPRSHVASGSMRYGLGLWIHATGDAVVLEGSDAGVSFRTLHDPASRAHLHGLVEHDRGRMADRPTPRRAAGALNEPFARCSHLNVVSDRVGESAKECPCARRSQPSRPRWRATRPAPRSPAPTAGSCSRTTAS